VRCSISKSIEERGIPYEYSSPKLKSAGALFAVRQIGRTANTFYNSCGAFCLCKQWWGEMIKMPFLETLGDYERGMRRRRGGGEERRGEGGRRRRRR